MTHAHDGRGERIAEQHERIQTNTLVLAAKLFLYLLKRFDKRSQQHVEPERSSITPESPPLESIDGELLDAPRRPTPLSSRPKLSGTQPDLLESVEYASVEAAPAPPPLPPASALDSEPIEGDRFQSGQYPYADTPPSIAETISAIYQSLATWMQEREPLQASQSSERTMSFSLGRYEFFFQGDRTRVVERQSNAILFEQRPDHYLEQITPAARIELLKMASLAQSNPKDFIDAISRQHRATHANAGDLER